MRVFCVFAMLCLACVCGTASVHRDADDRDFVKVKMIAVGVNFVDVLQVSGSLSWNGGALGLEGAGVIYSAEKGSRFKVGDHVMGLIPGGYNLNTTGAPILSVDSRLLIPYDPSVYPDHLAGAFIESAATALQVFHQANLVNLFMHSEHPVLLMHGTSTVNVVLLDLIKVLVTHSRGINTTIYLTSSSKEKGSKIQNRFPNLDIQLVLRNKDSGDWWSLISQPIDAPDSCFEYKFAVESS